jgi:ABC-type glutathione transport system ATPase component
VVSAPATSGPPFLRVRDLKTHFPVERGFLFQHRAGTVRAVDGVSFDLRQGEILGLVGESGCGKSTLGRSILQLIRPTGGVVLLDGCDLTALRGRRLRQARAGFQMIFQDPYASLNPRMTVFDALGEAILAHRRVPRAELPARVGDLLQKVGLPPRAQRKYPHEFSGGQRQRVAIARALVTDPRILIFDEATSALDYESERAIQQNMKRIAAGRTVFVIAHRLSTVRRADRIITIEHGRIVEQGTHDQLIRLNGRYAKLHQMQGGSA